jgi:aldose 1-epimerase
MSVINQIQQVAYKGKSVKVFELTHESGAKALISNYGCILMKLSVRDKADQLRDVVLGFDTIEEYWSEAYLKNYPYFSAIIGRYANRIKGASFPINGKQIQVSNNKDGNILHGGFEGFDKKVWDVVEIKNDINPSITFQYVSADAEEGFLGTLTTKFSVTLHANSLEYDIEASTDAPTAVNLSYHPYFNLDASASVNKQKAIIHANHWLEQDEDFCVTGKLIPTAGTNYDFSQWNTISQDWNKVAGYDQTFVANKTNGELSLLAEALSSDANLHMQVLSTEPVVHFYTGKWIPTVQGKQQLTYCAFSGYCFETHAHPNAVNIDSFPNTILRPGESYKHKTIYKFI